MASDTDGIRNAFHDFLHDGPAVEAAILSSTRASWSGGGYSIELFPTGTWRVLNRGDIGNLYISPGLILPIPALCEDEMDGSGDAEAHFYGNAIDELHETFKEWKHGETSCRKP